MFDEGEQGGGEGRARGRGKEGRKNGEKKEPEEWRIKRGESTFHFVEKEVRRRNNEEKGEKKGLEGGRARMGKRGREEGGVK